MTLNGNKEAIRGGSGEAKNKVKFSDTVQVAVVPVSVEFFKIVKKFNFLINFRKFPARTNKFRANEMVMPGLQIDPIPKRN